MQTSSRWPHYAAAAALAVATGCRPAPPPPPTTSAVYSPTSGRLEQIVADRDGDGTAEARAYMDGAALLRIELDRDADGEPDRWEYYQPATDAAAGQAATTIVRVDEANGPGSAVTRHEFFEAGHIVRVEEDTDLDGRIDKWEQYAGDVLRSVALDLEGRGRADRRLVYAPSGEVIRVEADPDGDGTFQPVEAEPPSVGPLDDQR